MFISYSWRVSKNFLKILIKWALIFLAAVSLLCLSTILFGVVTNINASSANSGRLGLEFFQFGFATKLFLVFFGVSTPFLFYTKFMSFGITRKVFFAGTALTFIILSLCFSSLYALNGAILDALRDFGVVSGPPQTVFSTVQDLLIYMIYSFAGLAVGFGVYMLSVRDFFASAIGIFCLVMAEFFVRYKLHESPLPQMIARRNWTVAGELACLLLISAAAYFFAVRRARVKLH